MHVHVHVRTCNVNEWVRLQLALTNNFNFSLVPSLCRSYWAGRWTPRGVPWREAWIAIAAPPSGTAQGHQSWPPPPQQVWWTWQLPVEWSMKTTSSWHHQMVPCMHIILYMHVCGKCGAVIWMPYWPVISSKTNDTIQATCTCTCIRTLYQVLHHVTDTCSRINADSLTGGSGVGKGKGDIFRPPPPPPPPWRNF